MAGQNCLRDCSSIQQARNIGLGKMPQIKASIKLSNLPNFNISGYIAWKLISIDRREAENTISCNWGEPERAPHSRALQDVRPSVQLVSVQLPVFF